MSLKPYGLTATLPLFRGSLRTGAQKLRRKNTHYLLNDQIKIEIFDILPKILIYVQYPKLTVTLTKIIHSALRYPTKQ